MDAKRIFIVIGLIILICVALISIRDSTALNRPACKYQTGYYAKDVGGGNSIAGKNGHCGSNCVQKLNMAPVDSTAYIGDDLSLTFWVDAPLGGPNMRCVSAATVDWGDGSSEQMPSEAANDCGVGDYKIKRGNIPKVKVSHHYDSPGVYCVSAEMWGNHKYDGQVSCSSDCFVRAQTIIKIFEKPKK